MSPCLREDYHHVLRKDLNQLRLVYHLAHPGSNRVMTEAHHNLFILRQCPSNGASMAR